MRATPPQGAGSFKPVALERGLTRPVRLQRAWAKIDCEKIINALNNIIFTETPVLLILIKDTLNFKLLLPANVLKI